MALRKVHRQALLWIPLVAIAFAFDLSRQPGHQATAKALIVGIRGYWAARAHLPDVHLCRFRPTCSVYTAQSLSKYGALKGLTLAGRRLLRCLPTTPAESYDPLI